MKKSKSGRIFLRVLLMIVTAGILIMLIWFGLKYVQRWLDANVEVSSSDVSTSDASEGTV